MGCFSKFGNLVGILAVDIFAKDTSKILTGGADKNATVFNKDLEQVVAVLKGHSKKVRGRRKKLSDC